MQRVIDRFLLANLYRKCTFCTSHTTDLNNIQKLIDFPVIYKAKDVEQRWYDIWQHNKYFNSKKISSKHEESFNMVLPPPNITGILHLGHALTATIQDVLARWHRMRGHSVLWIPGLDHAGIATQVVVERYLRQTRNLSRFDLGKKEFLSLVWQWKTEKADVIRNQLKIIGASVDWEKEYFTIDENYSTAVTEAFMLLHERNLLYRGRDLVNWSPALRSTISEIEVENLVIHGSTKLHVPGYKSKVTFGRLLKLAYPVKDTDEELIVATTRPETMFGDVAIAVHPDDERYSRYIGRHVLHPIKDNISIPIVADYAVKKEFGTGILKITPAHDRLDYDIAKRHNLPLISVIDEDGNMTDLCKNFKGLPRFIAREKLINELAVREILRGVEDNHRMILPRCSRSQDIVEYLMKEQWYIKCQKMAEKAVDALKKRSLKIEPDVHEQIWQEWLGSARDWCVSRQLWWGHPIPAYNVVDDDTSWIVARSEEEAYLIARKKYGNNTKLCRDPDVLDTWFSSAIVPFATLGWPKDTQDMARRYPLTLMETGHDILVFWVARMVMLGLELTQNLPFKEVLLHGILCDANGKKMSKSSGNVISPENIINGCSLEELNEQSRRSHAAGILNTDELRRTLRINAKSYPDGIPDCGTDTLRITLCGRNIKNRNINFDVADCKTNKNFCNKIWQAGKYVLLMTSEGQKIENENEDKYVLNSLDRWILSRLSRTVKAVNVAFAERNFHEAVTAIRQFLHYEFCDFYVEGTKFGFRDGDANMISGHSYTLKKCLEVFLRLFAPIAPYLSDDLYTRLAKKLSKPFSPVLSIFESTYPEPQEFEHLRDISLEKRMEKIVEVINAIRICMVSVSKKSNPERKEDSQNYLQIIRYLIIDDDINILMNNIEDYNLYKENVNLIKGASRIWNVLVYLKENYQIARKDEIEYIHMDDCSLFITAMDVSAMEQIRKNIAKRVEFQLKEKSKNQNIYN